jgi:magnesium transporter
MHQDTLAAVIALAVFLPIISDMSGCSGNQAVAVSMRELALGFVNPSDLWRVLGKEAAIGVVNGIALGVLLGLVGWIWQGNYMLGAVVGASLAANTLLAVCFGGSIPLVLRGLGQDPALASGPILTTITDMSGFFLVLTLAGAVLPWLTR